MNFFFILQLLTATKQKICINCKYYVSQEADSVYGQCSLFPKFNNHFLVNGVGKNEYYYCSTARHTEDMCGKEGKLYKKRRTPKKIN